LRTSRKHATRFLVTSFGECYESTVLMTACYWPPCHCIPTQTFVSVSVELNRNGSQWVMDSNNGVLSPLFIAYMN